MLRHSLAAFREEQRTAEKVMMSDDRKLVFAPRLRPHCPRFRS
jgi:hypothetical protein